MAARHIAFLALALAIPAVGCANLNAPSPQPNADQEKVIEQGFLSANSALAALAFVPGLPPAIVQEAQVVLAQLAAAHAAYVANPTATLADQIKAIIAQGLAVLAKAQPAVKAAAVAAHAPR